MVDNNKDLQDIENSVIRRIQLRSEKEKKNAEELFQHVQEMERDLERQRSELREREKKFQSELKMRESYFSEREKMLAVKQTEFQAHLASRDHELQVLRERLHVEISSREKELEMAQAELEKEKIRYLEEGRQRIQDQSNSYVSEALALLANKEEDFHSKSRVWGLVGATSLGLGLVFFLLLSIYSTISAPQDVSWQDIAYLLVKGIVVVALFGALAKYAHGFSASYMHEALKNADRRHAINFGKFYLQSYGASASWNEVKEAFEHWNIDGKSAFTKYSPKDPAISELGEVSKALKGIEKKLRDFGGKSDA